ncbi:MAG: hypothetical protein V1772_09610 [Chloroflexota bacterium]
MSSWYALPLWAGVGALMSLAHLWLLRRGLERAASLPADKASTHVLRGLPLRLLVWVPALWGAAVSGLAPCLGVVLGSLVGRWLVYGLCQGGHPLAWPRFHRG